MPGLTRSVALWALGAAFLTGCFYVAIDAMHVTSEGVLVNSEDPAGYLGQRTTSKGLQTTDLPWHEREGALSRRKRNILFASGIQICPEETFEHAIAHHLRYFHLRVCQETVWEAFKIFWARLPEKEEYQSWVSQCQDGSASVMDIGRYFSQSEEHRKLIRSRVEIAVALNRVHATPGPIPCSTEPVTIPPESPLDNALPEVDVNTIAESTSMPTNILPDLAVTMGGPLLTTTAGSMQNLPWGAPTENPVDLTSRPASLPETTGAIQATAGGIATDSLAGAIPDPEDEVLLEGTPSTVPVEDNTNSVPEDIEEVTVPTDDSITHSPSGGIVQMVEEDNAIPDLVEEKAADNAVDVSKEDVDEAFPGSRIEIIPEGPVQTTPEYTETPTEAIAAKVITDAAVKASSSTSQAISSEKPSPGVFFEVASGSSFDVTEVTLGNSVEVITLPAVGPLQEASLEVTPEVTTPDTIPPEVTEHTEETTPLKYPNIVDTTTEENKLVVPYEGPSNIPREDSKLGEQISSEATPTAALTTFSNLEENIVDIAPIQEAISEVESNILLATVEAAVEVQYTEPIVIILKDEEDKDIVPITEKAPSASTDGDKAEEELNSIAEMGVIVEMAGEMTEEPVQDIIVEDNYNDAYVLITEVTAAADLEHSEDIKVNTVEEAPPLEPEGGGLPVKDVAVVTQELLVTTIAWKQEQPTYTVEIVAEMPIETIGVGGKVQEPMEIVEGRLSERIEKEINKAPVERNRAVTVEEAESQVTIVETTESAIVKETKSTEEEPKSAIEEEPEFVVVEETESKSEESVVVEETTQTAVVQKTIEAAVVEETTQAGDVEETTQAKVLEEMTPSTVVQKTSEAEFVKETTQARVVEGTTKAAVEETTQTAASEQSTIVGEAIPSITEKETTQSWVVEETTKSAIEETTQSTVLEITTQSAVLEITSQAAVVEETTQAAVVEETTQYAVVEETTQATVVQKTSEPVVVKETPQSRVVEGTTKDEVEETPQSTVVETTKEAAVVKEMTEAAVVEETTPSVTVKETTQSRVVEETTKFAIEETTQSAVLEITTQAAVLEITTQAAVVEETTQAAVVEETTQAAVVKETTQAAVVEETTQAAVVEETTQATVVQKTSVPVVVKETPQSRVVEGTTKDEVKETPQSTVVETTKETAVVKEMTEAAVVEETTPSVTVKETTQSRVVEETTKFAFEETTQSAVLEKTTQAAIVEKTTQAAVVEETTPAAVVEETTQATVVQKNSEPVVVKETPQSTVVETTKEAAVVKETTEAAVLEETPYITVKETTQSRVVEETTTFAIEETTQAAVVEETSEPVVVKETPQSRVVEGTTKDAVEETPQSTVVETTKEAAIVKETTEATVVEETPYITVKETTQSRVVEETTTFAIEETTQSAVLEIITQAAIVEETTQAAVVEETTQAAVVEETSEPVVVEETSVPVVVKETPQSRVVEGTTKDAVEETPQSTVVETTEEAAIVKEMTEAAVVEKTTPSIVVKETTQSRVVVETAKSAIEETTPTAVLEITIEAAVLEETTQAGVLEETTRATVVQKTTEAAVLEETQSTVVEITEAAVVKETTEAEVVKETTEAAVVEETTQSIVVKETTQSRVVEETTKSAIEETTQTEVLEITTLAAVVEETTQATVLQKITEAAVIEETTQTTVVQKTSEAVVVKETTQSRVVKETTKDAVEETTQSTVVETTKEVAIVEETTPSIVVKETTQSRVVEVTTKSAIEEITQFAVVEITTQAAIVEETKQAAVVEETTQTTVVQKTSEAVVVKETPQSRVVKETTKDAVEETTQSRVVVETTQAAVVEETTHAAVVQKTTEAAVLEETQATVVQKTSEPIVVKETPQSRVVEGTTKDVVEETPSAVLEITVEAAVVEETTQVAVVEETTQAAVVEETTQAAVVEETTRAVVIDKSTKAAVVERTTQFTIVEETRKAAGVKDTTQSIAVKETTGSTETTEFIVPETFDAILEISEEITPVIVVMPEDVGELPLRTNVEETGEAKPSGEAELEIPQDPSEVTTEAVHIEPAVAPQSESLPEGNEDVIPQSTSEMASETLPKTNLEVKVEVQSPSKDENLTLEPTQKHIPQSVVNVSQGEAKGNISETSTEIPPDFYDGIPTRSVIEIEKESTQGLVTNKVAPRDHWEVTTKYVLEYNNGNFPELPERPTQDLFETNDGILENNGFGLEEEVDNTIGNEIDATLLKPLRPLRDQVVELSIRLRGESYNDDLRDPSSIYYQYLARQFTRRIEEAFDRLPEFKNVYVVEFRPQKDLERGLVVLVHYAITLEVDSTGISNKTMDFITLQNNMVERNYPAIAERPTVVHTITDLRNYITEALHKDSFLTNPSLDAEPGSSQQENAENLLALMKPTSRPADRSGNMDNVLAAEKPPDAPRHEGDGTDVFLKKQDLFDSLDPWKGPQTDTASENDVFTLDESAAPPAVTESSDYALDLQLSGSTQGNNGNVEDEGFPFSNTPGPVADTPRGDHVFEPTGSSTPSLPKPHPFDEGQDEGSGFSGDDKGTDPWSSQPSMTAERTEFDKDGVEVLPPPDLEVTEEEEEGDEETEGPAVTTPFQEEDFIEKSAQSTEAPWMTTTVPAVDELQFGVGVEEPLSDWVLVTQDISTDLRNTPTTQSPIFLTMKTLSVELSMQTLEPSTIYDSPTEPYTLVKPITISAEATTRMDKAPVLAGPTDTAEGQRGTMADVLEMEKPTEVVSKVPITSPEVTVVEEVEVIVEPEAPTALDTKLTDTTQSGTDLPALVEVEMEPVKESAFQTITAELPKIEEVTEKAVPPVPQTEDDEVEILEEQPKGVLESMTTAPPTVDLSQEDMFEDEVIAMSMATEAPVVTVPVGSDHSISLSPEKESPFTRVSDNAPEDEENLLHEAVKENAGNVPASTLSSTLPPPTLSPVIVSKMENAPTILPSLSQPTLRTTVELSGASVENENSNATLMYANEIATVIALKEKDPDAGNLLISGSPNQGNHEVQNHTVTSEIQPFEHGFSDNPDINVSFDVFQYDSTIVEGDSSGFSSVAQGLEREPVAMPVRPGRALTVFFRLRVTNMVFSMDLFNRSSAEYKSLEHQFLQLLVPYLQSNLTNFQNLEILNFRNGSIVVNSRMRFGQPVPRGVTTVVYLILEDFANTAYQTMNMAIDKYSLDVESGDRADPCKFQACNEFSKCTVNRWSGEAECVCDPGFFSVDSLPCRSICELKDDFCLNDGKCDIVPGKGAICRCRLGENWWYRGEHCEEYVSEPLVVGVAVASVIGFFTVTAGLVFFLVRTLREQYDEGDTEDPLRRMESIPALERFNKFNPMYDSGTVSAPHYGCYGDDLPHHVVSCTEGSRDLADEEMQRIYQNTALTKEEIEDRVRIIELCATDEHFVNFVRQTQVFLERRGSSST